MTKKFASVSRARLISTLALAVAACSNDATGVIEPEPVPVTITITTPSVVRDGDVVQLTAAARTAAGAVVPGVSMQWSVSDATIATISESGVLTALRDGSTQVTARALVNGRALEQRVTVPVTLHPAVALDVNQAVVELPLTSTTRVATTLRGEDGRVLQHRALTWTSDDPAIARVEADGRIVAVSSGTTLVRVRFGTLSAAVQVRVPAVAATVYDVAQVNGRATPAVVEEYTADEAAGPQRYQVRLESGTVTWGSTYRVSLQVATYKVSELQGNVIMQLVGRSTVTDYGTIEYNWLTGAATLQSTLVGGLSHAVEVSQAGPDIQFRLPGTNTLWTLAARVRN